MSNILVTGANGLVGYDLIKLLCFSEENRVFGISRSKPDFEFENYKHLNIDFSKEWDINSLPPQIDVIYHLAQSENFRAFPESALDVFDVNTRSTLKLLDYGRKVGLKKFIYSSSGGVYGTNEGSFDEDAVVSLNRPLGFYLGTKLCSEIIVESYVSQFDVVISRLFFVYGPRQRKTMLIPRLVENIKLGNSIKLAGEDGIKINPIYVDDAANALKGCIESIGSNKINIAGNEVMSLRGIGEMMGEVLGKSPIFEKSEQFGENLIGNTSKMKELLHVPKVDLKSGLRKIILM